MLSSRVDALRPLGIGPDKGRALGFGPPMALVGPAGSGSWSGRQGAMKMIKSNQKILKANKIIYSRGGVDR